MLQPCKQTQFPLLVPEKTKKPDGCDLASPFGKKDTPFAFLLLDVTLLRDIQTVKKLSNILVSDPADLLNICRALGNILERIAGKDEFVFLCLRDLDCDTWAHVDSPHNLFTNEVSNFNELCTILIILKVDIDWKMGVDVSHLVLETLGDTDNKIVDNGADSA